MSQMMICDCCGGQMGGKSGHPPEYNDVHMVWQGYKLDLCPGCVAKIVNEHRRLYAAWRHMIERDNKPERSIF